MSDAVAEAEEVAARLDPQPTAQLVRLSDVQPETVRWLWAGRIPLGKLTVLDGDPGLGKSTMTLDLAARASTGSPLPDGSTSDLNGPGGVVLLSAEDGLADTIRPRLDAARADCRRVVALEGWIDAEGKPHGVALCDLDILRQAISSVHAALVVIDPLMSYLPSRSDAHRDQDIRAVLSPLSKLAEETRAAVVVVRHLNKAAGGQALYRGSGSIGIIGAARSGLLVAPDPDDDTRRILVVAKSNLAAPVPALAYRLEPYPPSLRVRWEGATTHTATQLLAVPSEPEERGALAEAVAFLHDILADGPLPAKDAQQQARAAGIADATLRRARTTAAVQVSREGFGKDGRWLWTLPAEHRCSPTPIGAYQKGVSIYGGDEHVWAEQAVSVGQRNGHVAAADVDNPRPTWPCRKCGARSWWPQEMPGGVLWRCGECTPPPEDGGTR